MLFFGANDGASGSELWKSNGTTVGTMLVADISPGPASSYPRYLTVGNGRLFFSADDGLHGREPWILGGKEDRRRGSDSELGVASGNSAAASILVGPPTGGTGILPVPSRDANLVASTGETPAPRVAVQRSILLPPPRAANPGEARSTAVVERAFTELELGLLDNALLNQLALAAVS